MKTKLILILSIFLMSCGDTIVTSELDIHLSGQYQNEPYDEGWEPSIILLISQKDNELTGSGNFNGIPFSFTGTVIDTHIMINFTLHDTNIGTLYGSFDFYNLAGNYSLRNDTYYYSNKLRIKKVAI